MGEGERMILLLSVLAIDNDGDRAVVDQLYLHIGSKLARLNLLAEEVGEPTDKLLVHRYGHLGLGGMDIAGTIAFLGAGHQRKLTDEQNATVWHIGDGQIHYPVRVIENAQGNYLTAKPVDIFICVGIFNAEKNHHSLPYQRFQSVLNGNRGTAATLYYYSHDESFCLGLIGCLGMS